LKEQFRCEVGEDGGAGKSRHIVFFLVLLAVVGGAVLAAHWPCVSAKALMLDDDQYLVENRLVQNPGWTSAKRFVTEVLRPSTVRGYYQPLAMMSLMLDVAVGGDVDNLRPFRLTSLSLHVANSLLLVVFLYLLFGQIAPAVMAGLLYGVHPVAIESVAWIAERKTLLAAFFALWCLIFYVLYIRRQNWRYGIICLAMYVLSLLSKPAVAAMPVLLLLLDFWPFRRLGRRAILEKLPLFVIGCIFSVITFISQSGTSMVKLPGESGLVRLLLTFCHNIVFYLYSFLWPVNLSWYYAFPKPFNLSEPAVLFGVIGTGVLIVVLLLSLRWTRCLVVGWLFFFAAVFPTLGVVGFHPVIAADRHLYFPMVGFLLSAVWLVSRSWSGEGKILGLGRSVRRGIIVSAVLLLGASEFILTRCYLVYWRDTESVYKYMLESSPDVMVLHNNLANVLNDSGKVDEAVEHFNRALELKPNSAEIHNNLGNALRNLGEIDSAIAHYRKALEYKPKFAAAHYNLAVMLAGQGKADEAIAEYRKALRLKPDDVDTLSNLGFELAQTGKSGEAIKYYNEALKLQPDSVITHGRLGLALAAVGKIDEAIREFQIVLKERPGDVEMYCNLGVLLERQGKIAEAIEQYREALQINPEYVKAVELLEAALEKRKKR